MSTPPTQTPTQQHHTCHHHQTYKHTHICWKNSGRCPYAPETEKICKHYTSKKQK